MTADTPADNKRLEREIRRLRHELHESVRALPHLRQMIEFSGDLLILVDGSGRILETNGRLEELLGLSRDQIYGQPLYRWLANPAQVKVLMEHLASRHGAPQLRILLDLQSAKGEPLPMELEGHRLELEGDVDPASRRWTLSLRNLSEHRRLEALEGARQVQESLIVSLRASEARYRDLVKQLVDGIAQIDPNTTIVFANPSLDRILGVTEGQLCGRRLCEFLPLSSLPGFEQAWSDAIARKPHHCTLAMFTAKGDLLEVELILSPISDGDEQRADVSLVNVLIRDITVLNRTLNELTELRFHDPLTGLDNAVAVRRNLETLLHENLSRPLLVLWLDLDGFRRVNHCFGRAAGDALLQEFAKSLKRFSNSSDLISRIGGDEFLLVHDLQCDVDDKEDLHAEVIKLLGKLHNELPRINQLPGLPEFVISFTAGYSLAPLHGMTADSLLQAAATALSRARDQVPGTVIAYQSSYTKGLQQEMALESRLLHAFDKGFLRLVYQPQYIASGTLVGAEALLRWHDPVHGVVPPALFVPIAERTGFINTLGQWVLEQVCCDIRAWIDAGLNPPRVAVNLSARQFEATSPPLVQQVEDLLARYALQPGQLELEITESYIVPISGVMNQVKKLLSLGVQVALDDFGTGYSSLAVLNKLKINKVKIDRSFVRDLEASESSRTLVKAAIAMSAGLGLEVLAEGVETQGQLEVLESLGCDAYQGYLFSKPLEASAYRDLLGNCKTEPKEEGRD